MTAADWAVLVPAIVGVLGAGAAWLRAHAVNAKLTAHKQQDHGPRL
jgi:hypothetical protein